MQQHQHTHHHQSHHSHHPPPSLPWPMSSACIGLFAPMLRVQTGEDTPQMHHDDDDAADDDEPHVGPLETGTPREHHDHDGVDQLLDGPSISPSPIASPTSNGTRHQQDDEEPGEDEREGVKEEDEEDDQRADGKMSGGAGLHLDDDDGDDPVAAMVAADGYARASRILQHHHVLDEEHDGLVSAALLRDLSGNIGPGVGRGGMSSREQSGTTDDSYADEHASSDDQMDLACLHQQQQQHAAMHNSLHSPPPAAAAAAGCGDAALPWHASVGLSPEALANVIATAYAVASAACSQMAGVPVMPVPQGQPGKKTYAKLSDEQHKCIIDLYNAHVLPPTISTRLNINLKSVYTYIARYKKTGQVVKRQKGGNRNKNVLDDTEKQFIVRAMHENPHCTLRHIQDAMQAAGLKPRSIQAIGRILKKEDCETPAQVKKTVRKREREDSMKKAAAADEGATTATGMDMRMGDGMDVAPMPMQTPTQLQPPTKKRRQSKQTTTTEDGPGAAAAAPASASSLGHHSSVLDYSPAACPLFVVKDEEEHKAAEDQQPSVHQLQPPPLMMWQAPPAASASHVHGLSHLSTFVPGRSSSSSYSSPRLDAAAAASSHHHHGHHHGSPATFLPSPRPMLHPSAFLPATLQLAEAHPRYDYIAASAAAATAAAGATHSPLHHSQASPCSSPLARVDSGTAMELPRLPRAI